MDTASSSVDPCELMYSNGNDRCRGTRISDRRGWYGNEHCPAMRHCSTPDGRDSEIKLLPGRTLLSVERKISLFFFTISSAEAHLGLSCIDVSGDCFGAFLAVLCLPRQDYAMTR